MMPPLPKPPRRPIEVYAHLPAPALIAALVLAVAANALIIAGAPGWTIAPAVLVALGVGDLLRRRWEGWR